MLLLIGLVYTPVPEAHHSSLLVLSLFWRGEKLIIVLFSR
jgi:hypothetical protein